VRDETKARLQLHAAVLTWGFTSILGRLITLPALALVWWRMLFAVAALSLASRVRRRALALPRRTALAYAGAGALLATHWLAFFGAVKLANASVAVACLGTAPPMVALMDPLFGNGRFAPRDLVLGLAVAPGVALIAGGVPTGMHLGVVVGIVAAVLVALLAVVNKRLVGQADDLTMTWLELAGGLALLTVIGAAAGGRGPLHALPDPRDTALLLVLATVCTVLPTTAYLRALRHLPAFGVQLTINLEPVYSILLAAILLGEGKQLSMKFYAGTSLLMAGLFIHSSFSAVRRSANG
jgi:drug/metabolite transporter (DMT)-like permease